MKVGGRHAQCPTGQRARLGGVGTVFTLSAKPADFPLREADTEHVAVTPA